MSHSEKYTYRVQWSEQDGEFIGLCAEFPSLSWLAKTDDEAFHGIKKVVFAAVADMKRNQEPLPEPLGMRHYSGSFKIRIPPTLHRRLAVEANDVAHE